MPDFNKLSFHVNRLSKLLSDKETGLATWCSLVGEHWCVIVEMWKRESKTTTENDAKEYRGIDLSQVLVTATPAELELKKELDWKIEEVERVERLLKECHSCDDEKVKRVMYLENVVNYLETKLANDKTKNQHLKSS